MFDNAQVQVALISTIGGIAVTYLTIKYKNKVIKPPKDRLETIFDGYEALIKQQQGEISRKSVLIDRLEEQLTKMEELVERLRQDLSSSQKQIDGLSNQLVQMKLDYGKLKATDSNLSQV